MGCFAGFFGTWLMNAGRRGRLFETLRDRGPLAADELAAALGYEHRYVETWCRGAYAFELLDEQDGRFRLAEGVAEIMLDSTDPSFMGGRAEFFPLLTPDLEMYAERMADGGLYPLSERPPSVVDTLQAAVRADAPNAIANVLPQEPGLVERLRAGGSVLDAGCGAGYGLAAFAEAFPQAELVGIDLDEASLSRARARLGARAELERVHVTEAVWAGRFDLVYANIAISHTWGSGPEVFAALLRLLRPGGALLCSDVPYPASLADLRSPAGRLFTGVTAYVSLLGFTLLTPEALVARLQAAGFDEPRIAQQPARTRMMALARRPLAAP